MRITLTNVFVADQEMADDTCGNLIQIHQV